MSAVLSQLMGEERGLVATIAVALVLAAVLAAGVWYALHSTLPESLYQKLKGIVTFYSVLAGMVIVGWKRLPGFLLIFFGILFAAFASAFY